MSEKVYAYHLTKRENLDGILRNGLKPYDKKNFPSRQGQEPPAIWVFMDDFTAVWWANLRSETYGTDWVVLKVDMTDIPVKEDFKLPEHFFRSYKTEQDIPKYRIFLNGR